jgi:amidohydrolase
VNSASGGPASEIKRMDGLVDLVTEARSLQSDLVLLRRQIHRSPELGLHLPATQAAILSALDGLPLETTTGRGLSSVVAVLRGGRSTGRSVLLRGDMDALPGAEETNLDFAATGEAMHACGHDLHVAMLVGAARLLCSRRSDLTGDVVFMFQPGEEGCDGARHMIEEGVIEASGQPASVALALHVESSRLRKGLIATRPGTVMSAAQVLRVTVKGAGGHGSAPHLAMDPIPAAAEMITALQTLVTRHFDVFDPVVITVGTFHAGTQYNVIPDVAHFEATVRSFSRAAHSKIGQESVKVCQQVGAAHGLNVDAHCDPFYPVTVNDETEVAFFRSVVENMFGSDRMATLPFPRTGSEDFSRVLEVVPGVMAFLGACNPTLDPSEAPFNHSAHAIFDDEVLSDGAALYAQFAQDRLANQSHSR